MLAISFMNEILVASIAFATYLVISALFTSIKINLSWFATNGSYNSFNISVVCSSSVPIITLSGCKQSSIATPSFKNSGFDAIEIFTLLILFSSIISLTLKPVPTGTVDLVTTNESLVIFSAICLATLKTKLRLTLPPSASGVPTAIKIIFESFKASFKLVVKNKLFLA